MTTADLAGSLSSARPNHAAAQSRRLPRPVPTWWRDASGAALWGVLLWVTALWVGGGGVTDLASLSGFFTSTGRLTGLIASALLLVQVFLMARVPWFEQAWGQDGLARLHRTVGFTSFNLMWAHILLITVGYAAASPQGFWGTLVDFVVNYPGMLLAVAGTAALVMVVVTSVKKARAKLRYESWHLIHLYGYLGAGLALPHQLWTGKEFLSSPVATAFWWTLYAVAAGAVLVYRVGLPLRRSLQAKLVVSDVRAEGPSATTVTVTGRGVRHLPVQAGQFFTWRFLDGPGWTRGHPYSLSAAPDGRSLQFTAAHLGDGSAALAELKRGTPVLVEGPYGRLHSGVRTRRKVLLMGAGIGITPLKAILEELPQHPGEVTVIQRGSSRHGLVLADEIRDLALARGARHIVVEGHRLTSRRSWLPAQAAHLTDARALRELVPDVADHDVFLCGAPEWMDAARDAALACGVPPEHIHSERFAF